MSNGSARLVAVRALDKLGGGIQANRVLDRELGDLGGEERSLATAIFYGVIRRRITLDYWLEKLSGRSMERIQGDLRNVLRVGLFQLRYLDRVPPWAAINEAVEMAKGRGPGRGGAFVNAVLREATRREIPSPEPGDDLALSLAVTYSQPTWLIKGWQRILGSEIQDLLAANLEIPPLVLRTNPLRADPARLRQLLGGSPGRYFPEAICLPGAGGPLREMPGYGEGYFSVQDESGMAAVHALAPQPGERILDLCAGAGGKTTALAEAMGDRGEIIALDTDGGRLNLLAENTARLGLASITQRQADLRKVADEYKALADRVLLDAPCSGTGVIRRRPDIGWGKGPSDIRRMAQGQRELLEAASGMLRPGGILVYATCSAEVEEGEAIVAAFLRDHPEYGGDPLDSYLPKELLDTPGSWQVRLWPHRHGTDGFYMARLKRREVAD